jgi:excisionase family DNA binding protein
MNARAASDAWLSVREASRYLGVSESTVWRWIKQGRVKAYRIGPRRVRLKESDVAALISPVESNDDEDEEAMWARLREELSKPPTEEERSRRLAALAEGREFARRLIDERGGKLFEPPAWVLINEARDERTEQLP